MQTITQNPQAVNPSIQKAYPSGQPLTERVAKSVVLAERAYAYEFDAAGGERVYGCYAVPSDDAAAFEQLYALETVHDNRIGDVACSCNCPDRVYRKRICKHMVELAVVLGTGLRTPKGVFVAAVSATVISQPRTVAEALRAMREDYHAAAARAVILTAAAVEEAEQQEAAPRKAVSGFAPAIFDDWK